VGQKAPFKLKVKVKDIWALRVRLQMESRGRELALSTVRYLGIEIDDALEISVQTEI
jgi:hypothetical protein